MITNERYEELKQQYQTQLGSETLKKFKILNEAFNIGKKLRGRSYTYVTLSIDFDIPYTTCKRVLALRKANKRNWKLIREGKISSFKVAMILLQKNVTYQDELIDLVIKENLSTYDLKNLKDGSLKEVNDNRLKLAVDQGFVRKQKAYESFKMYLGRVNELTLIDVDRLPKNKLSKLKNECNKTVKSINKFMLKLTQL